MPLEQPVVVLARDSPSGRAVVNALAAELPDVRAIFEQPERPWRMLRRRAGRVGIVTATGQALFRVLVMPILRRTGHPRIQAIAQAHGLDLGPVGVPVDRVDTVNDATTARRLEELRPSVVVVNGTRILGAATLSAIACPAINLHAGITPGYRGSHGGYWALVDGRPEYVGTTIHLVDAGVDTGTIVAQVTFAVEPVDTIATYPYLHLAVGLPALVQAVREALGGSLATVAPPAGLASRLRAQPTIWQYIWTRLRHGVR